MKVYYSLIIILIQIINSRLNYIKKIVLFTVFTFKGEVPKQAAKDCQRPGGRAASRRGPHCRARETACVP